MPRTCRTYRFPARLSRAGHDRLDQVFGLLTDLYNAGLEERIGAYRQAQTSRSYFDQCRQITALRAEDPQIRAVDVRVLRSPLNRLNKAFGSFFSRLKRGDKPGFPRFRSRHRYRSFELDDNAQSVLKLGLNGRHRIRIKGLPALSFKPGRELPPRSDLKVLRVVRTARRTEVHLVYQISVLEPIGLDQVQNPVGLDLGVLNLLACSDGTVVPGRKPDRSQMKRLQRKLSRAKRGSNSRSKRRKTLARAWQVERERSRGYLHELSARLVRQYDRIVLEDLKIRNMTRSARGTVDQPGHNVRAKAGLNRSIHEQAWGTLVQMLVDKAEQAGRRVEQVAPHHTSQDCSGCSRRVPKRLSNRVHRCPGCGLVLDRDVNAARNVWLRAVGSDSGGTGSRGVGQTFGTNGHKTTGPDSPGPAQPVDPERYTRVA